MDRKQYRYNINSNFIINKECYELMKSHYHCIICSYLLLEPQMCTKCDSIFCKQCIKKWLNSNNACPNGCSKTDDILAEINKYAKKMLDELKLKCKYGCIVPFTSYISHLNECEKNHNDDLSCWNCDNITKINKMKIFEKDKVTNLKKENISLREKEKENLLEKVEVYNVNKDNLDMIKLTNEKIKIDNLIFDIKLKLEAKENKKALIKKLEAELSEGDCISELTRQIDNLKIEKYEILLHFEEYFITKKKEYVDKKSSIITKELNSQVDLLYKELLKEKFLISIGFGIKEQTLRGHSNTVYSIIKITESQIASGSGDNTIKIWDMLTSTCIKTLKEHSESVYCLIKLNNTQIASGSGDHSIKVWDIMNIICTDTLNGHQGAVYSLLRLNDFHIASGSCDDSIKIWNLSNSTCLITLIGHTDSVESLVKIGSSQNIQIVSGSFDNTIKVWDVNMESEKYQCSKTLIGHSYNVNSIIKISNNQVASGSRDKSIKIWNLQSGLCIKTLIGHIGAVYSLIKINDTQIASGSIREIKIWDVLSSVCLKTISEHSSTVWSLIKLNDNQLASGSDDSSIKICPIKYA